MEQLKLFLSLYLRPGWAFSEIMDRGNWIVAAGLCLLVGVLFFGGVNAKLDAAYRIPTFSDFATPGGFSDDPQIAEQQMERAGEAYQAAVAERKTIPLIGDVFFKFFSFEPSGFYRPLLAISLFYVPLLILLVAIFSGIGSFGLLLRRDYAVLATATLMAWAAANLPSGLIGLAIFSSVTEPSLFFSLWIAAALLFGILMLFAIRTIFGVGFGVSFAATVLAWPAFSVAMYVFQYVSPWLLSPFLLFYAFLYLGGSIGGEVRGFGNAFRQRQNLKRFLQNATVNPRDADAHVQLGLIYLQRMQTAKAREHFEKAAAIDPQEIDANFELGKLARNASDLQKALDHFAIVAEQNDKFRLSEIWREIGATYLAAGMTNEAHEALEKFVDRRGVDPEGLYYFGKCLKLEGEQIKSREMFELAIESATTSPYFRSKQLAKWSKLAEKELSLLYIKR